MYLNFLMGFKLADILRQKALAMFHYHAQFIQVVRQQRIAS